MKIQLPKKSAFEIGFYAFVVLLLCIFLLPNYSSSCQGHACSQTGKPVSNQITAALQIASLASLSAILLSFLYLLFLKRDFYQTIPLGLLLAISVLGAFFGTGLAFNCTPAIGCQVDFGGLGCILSSSSTLNVLIKPSENFFEIANSSIVITKLSCTMKKDQFEDIGPLRVGIGEEVWANITCNDESGEPIRFNRMDPFCGYLNIEYYVEDEGPESKVQKSGRAALWAYSEN